MTLRCPQCHEQLPDTASFCINCRALLQPAAGPRLRLTPVASGTTVHLLRLGAPRNIVASGQSALADALIALVALGFAMGEIVGIAQLIAQNGWVNWDLWPALLLASGALLAENDWLNGALRRGLYGIVCWGALPWLLVAQPAIAWLMLPALGWWLIWLFDWRSVSGEIGKVEENA